MKEYQLDGNDCGASCLKYLVKYYQGNISLERARELTYTGKDGTNMYNLKKAFLQLGFSVNGYFIPIEELNKYHQPMIAMIKINNFNHFVVINKITNQYIYLFDPSRGKRKYMIDEFKTLFSGYILVAKPRMPMIQEIENNELKKIIKERIKEYKYQLLTIILLSAIIAIFTLIDSIYLKIIIDKFNGPYHYLLSICLIFTIILIIKEFLLYYYHQLIIKFSYNMNLNLTNQVLSRLLSLPISFFSNRSTGEIVERLKGIENLHNLVIEVAGSLLISMIFFVIATIYLLNFSLMLYVIIFFFILILIILLIIYHYYFKDMLINSYHHLDIFNNQLINILNKINSIYHLQLGSYIKNKLVSYHKSYIDEKSYYQFLQNKLNLFKGLIYVLANTSIILYSLYLSKNNVLTIGSLVQINILFSLITHPVENLFILQHTFRTAVISYLRLDQIFSVKQQEISLLPLKTISFSNITYAYNGINPVLTSFNTKFELGDKVFICGPSGSGKSTIFKLMANYDQRYQGNINLSDFNYNLIYLSQEESIFNCSLTENIILDQPLDNHKFNSIINLTKLNHLLHDCEINHHNISGGEAQRIILARALYRNFDFLILDESLSQVDPELSENILTAIIKTYHSKTIIYASHQLPNLQLFNKIIELERSDQHAII